MDGDYSVFSILPPYNTIHAQVINPSGKLVVAPSGITVTYEAVTDAQGSINVTSTWKTNFWAFAQSLFGASSSQNQGSGVHVGDLGTVHPSFVEGDVYRNLIVGFSSRPVAFFYVLAMLALGLHLRHGIWSMLQTLGLSHPRWNRLRFAFSTGMTLLVVIGNISIPLAIMTGLVR